MVPGPNWHTANEEEDAHVFVSDVYGEAVTSG